MKVKCEYCGSFISDTALNCPSCGAPNEHMMRSAVGVPKTVEELRAFCTSHRMPLEKMRFFIGEDCHEPRAFGIYREDDGDWVVYKYKSDGSRVVRYRGKDEAYAVNELYQKLKSEVSARRGVSVPRSAPAGKDGGKAPMPKSRFIKLAILLAVLIVMVAACTSYLNTIPDMGYYSYDGGQYYYDLDSWYLWDTGSSQWLPGSVDSELDDNYGDYWQSYDYQSSSPASDFDSSQYSGSTEITSNTGSTESTSNTGSSWDSDWDSDDWDYDYDSWDSDSTDWDSDW